MKYYPRTLLLLSHLFLVMAAAFPAADSSQLSGHNERSVDAHDSEVTGTLHEKRREYTGILTKVNCCPVAGWGWQPTPTSAVTSLVEYLNASGGKCLYPANPVNGGAVAPYQTGCQRCGCQGGPPAGIASGIINEVAAYLVGGVAVYACTVCTLTLVQSYVRTAAINMGLLPWTGTL